MRYQPKIEVGDSEDPKEWIDALSNWAYMEFSQIEQALAEPEAPIFREWHAEPTRPRDGMTVFADGSDWNPGSGQGIYTYYAVAWHKLG